MSDIDSDLRKLSADLTSVSKASAAAAYDAIKESADDLRDTWRRNAKETSGKAAKFYPDTIVWWPKVGRDIVFEVYPDARVNGQAKLGEILEFGTSKNPPHLDGHRAMDAVRPRMDRRVASALGKLLADRDL